MNLSLRIERAADRQSRVGLSEGKGADVARAFGVKPSTRSHWAGRGDGPLKRVCAAVQTVPCDEAAAGMAAAVQAALEHRALLRAGTPTLLSRAAYLFDREPLLAADLSHQRVLWLAGGPMEPFYAAASRMASLQAEFCEAADELEARGVLVRDLLLGRARR